MREIEIDDYMFIAGKAYTKKLNSGGWSLDEFLKKSYLLASFHNTISFEDFSYLQKKLLGV